MIFSVMFRYQLESITIAYDLIATCIRGAATVSRIGIFCIAANCFRNMMFHGAAKFKCNLQLVSELLSRDVPDPRRRRQNDVQNVSANVEEAGLRSSCSERIYMIPFCHDIT